jgi:hypothetical protein
MTERRDSERASFGLGPGAAMVPAGTLNEGRPSELGDELPN